MLARAVKWHSEHRVLINGHKTVIFPRARSQALGERACTGASGASIYDDQCRTLGQLYRQVAAMGGVVNIAKDSRLTAAVVRKVFPEYDRFRDGLNRFDPKRRFDSALRRRLDV